MDNMKKIRTMVQCENQKIYSQNKYRILIFIISILVALGAALSFIPGNIVHFTLSNYPYTALSFITYLLGPISIMMLSSDLIANEITSSEIKVYLTRPVARYQVILAKVIAIAQYCGCLLLITAVVSTVISAFATGFASQSLLTIGAAYLAGFVPLLMLCTLFSLVQMIAKSQSSGFAGCVILFFGLMAAGVCFPQIGTILPTSYLGIGQMVMGSSIPVSNFITGMILLIGYSVVFASLSILGFLKKEF